MISLLLVGLEEGAMMCFGLSSKNKLYVGELIMKVGVNSFSINADMGMIVYVTVGQSFSLKGKGCLMFSISI